MLARRKNSLRWLFAVLIASLSLTVAACSDDDGGDDPDAGADAAEDTMDGDAGTGDDTGGTDTGGTDTGGTDTGGTDTGGTDTGGTDTGGTDTGGTDTGDQDATQTNTIADIVAGSDDFSTLATALGILNLVETFAGDDIYTVFAPTNDAFDALPVGLLEAALGDEELLTTVLNLHVVTGEVPSGDIAVGESIVETLGGTNVLVVNDGNGNITVGGAPVGTPDVDADNGIVHIMDAVILPASTVTDLAANADGDIFSTLVSALTAAELASVLAGDGDYMVFAPTNDAFDALPAGTVEGLLEDIDTLTDILLFHVVDGAIASGDIPAGDTELEALNEGMLTVNNTDGTITVNGIAVVNADIVASNGVIHAIEGVLLPPAPGNSIVDIAAGDARLGTLVETLGAYPDLVELLSADGTFTVFAPTDAAFAEIAEVIPTLSEDEIRNILEYHVLVGQSLDATAVLGSSLLTMANGIDAKVDGDAVTIAGAPISDTNIAADNGTIHVIDSVMLPPGDIPTVATEAGVFGDLVDALTAASLVDDVAGEGPLTVFAPDDDAFAAAAAAVTAIGDNVDILTTLLLSHVAEGRFAAADVVASTSIEMLSGIVLPVVVGEDAVTIGGAAIAATDIPASNGIIHIMADVIVPNDIAGVATEAGVFTELLAALVATDLADDVSFPNGPITVFAPTDEAFGAIAEVVAVLSTDEIAEILLYHVVPGNVPSEEVVASTILPTLGGGALAVDAEAGTVGGASLSDTLDVPALNGTIHIIDDVILPPGLIPDVAANAGVFETLLAAVTAAELAATLVGDGPFTVFAPTDDAFMPLVMNGTVNSLLLEDGVATLTDLLLYHVVAGSLIDASGARAAAGGMIEMANGGMATVGVDAENAITLTGMNTVTVVLEDVPATNGIVHAIDAVLLPMGFMVPETTSIVDLAGDTDGLSTLVATLGGYPDLVELLNGPGEFTVFAPTNAAFDDAADLIATLTDDEIRDVLLYHVVDTAALDSGAVLGESLIRMANGVYAKVDAGAGTIAGAPISGLDNPTDNGIVHIVDAVMVPPGNIAQVATEAGIFGSLLAALEATMLAATIADGGPFTVFAPTDDAFLAIEGALAVIGDNTDIIARLLLSHVVDGELTAADVLASESLTTLSGVVVEVDAGALTIGGAAINATDVPARNGIIHVMNDVILPDDITTVAAAAGFSELVAALEATELDDDVSMPNGPFTVFAPTNDAFIAIADTLAGLDLAQTSNILLSHVAEGVLDSTAVLEAGTIEMLSGTVLTVDAEALTIGGAALNDANLDIFAVNGVIHVLDDVIVPAP